MSEQQPVEDTTGVTDEVTVNQPNPDLELSDDGTVLYREGVSGPDSRFWGQDHERPNPFDYEESAQEGAGGVEPDTISPEGVSGPDSRFWTKALDDDGTEQYVGRDEMNYLEPAPEVTDLRPQELVEAEQRSIAEVDEAVTIAQPEVSDAEGGMQGEE